MRTEYERGEFVVAVRSGEILRKKKRVRHVSPILLGMADVGVVVGETGTRTAFKENGSYSPSWQRPSGRLRILITAR